MGLWELLTGKKKKGSQQTEQQDAVEMKDLASQIMGLKAMGNQGVIESIDSDDLSVFGDAEDEQPGFHKDRQKNGTITQTAGNQEEIDSDDFLEQMSVLDEDDLQEKVPLFSEVGNQGESDKSEQKVGFEEETPNAIEYERISDKERKKLTGKKVGEVKALLAGKSPDDGIAAIRKKYRLTAEDMKNPDAVPRMTEPYFRTAISDLSGDKSLSLEQQKALSDFSEEMDQQMMINAMKAPGRDQRQNLRDAFRDDEESEQVGRELKAHRIGKLFFGKEGFKSNLRSMFFSSTKPNREEVDEKTREEENRQKESARSLLKIFLMLQIGNMQMRETNQETGEEKNTDWAHNMSDLFAHGGRIVIETGDQSADPEKKDSVGDVMASVFSKTSALEKRVAATHYIAEGDMGDLKEEKGKIAALKGFRDDAWENYGMPVAIGGSGSKGPRMFDKKSGEGNRIIRNDNRNGHLYVGKKEGSVKQHGGFLIGLESDAPYRMNQWGHVHTMWATSERIKSTGGMKKDLHGDETSGRNLDLGGMKNEDLVRLMKEVDTGFNDLYGSEDEEKQKEYDEILRKLTGKRLEADAVEEILRKLTQKKDLGIRVEKIRSESRGLRPILPKELMDEPVEEPVLTPEEKKRREERDEKLKRLLPDAPSDWQRFEVEESSGKDPVGPKEGDMVSRFLAAQGKSLRSLQEEAEKRAQKKEEEKKKHGDPYADVPLDVGPLFYEDDKSPEAKKEYEEANRKAEEKLKKEKGGDQVYDPEKVGQDWLYDRDENGKYYSAQVSSDPTHFGKTHKLDTSAYLILADQVIRVDDYIAGRTTLAEEKAVKEIKPESGETVLVPFAGKFTEFSETMQKNCMEGIQNLRKFMEQYAPPEENEAWQKLFSSIELYEKALSTGQNVEPETFFRSIPAESITFRGSYDLRKLVETGITNDQLAAVHKFLEITDTQNPAILGLSGGIAAVQSALAGAAGGLKRLPAPGKEQGKKQKETRSLKLIGNNPFSNESQKTGETKENCEDNINQVALEPWVKPLEGEENPEEKTEEAIIEELNLKPEEKKEESSKNPKDDEGPIFPNPWDIIEISQELLQEPKPEEKKKEELKPEEKKKEEPKPEEKKEEPKISSIMGDFFFKPIDKQKKEKKEEPLKKKQKESQIKTENLNSKVPKLVQKIPAESSKEEVKLPKGKDIGTDVMLEKQLTGASCYAYVAAALLRHFGERYELKNVASVKEEDFLKVYGGKRERDGHIYPRKNNRDFYYGYKFKKEKKAGLRKDFPKTAEIIGEARLAQSMNDIVEAIHQLSGGKAALNSKIYQKENYDKSKEGIFTKADLKNMEDLKKTIMHVVNERKMPIGLNCMTYGDGHYVLVVGADKDGYSYKDPLHPDVLKKEKWDSLKMHSPVTINFLQHRDEISPEGNENYSDLNDLTNFDNEAKMYSLLQKYPEEHLKHINIYEYDDKKYSYYSLLPKKEKKKK